LQKLERCRQSGGGDCGSIRKARGFSKIKKPVSGTSLSLIKDVTDVRRFSTFLVWAGYTSYWESEAKTRKRTK